MNIAKMCHPRGFLFALNCMQMIEYWELPAAPGRASLEAACGMHHAVCQNNCFNLQAFTGSLARGPGVFFAFSTLLGAVFQVMAHTTHTVSKFCASHIVSGCFIVG